MKKFFMLLAVIGVMAASASIASAQADNAAAPQTEQVSAASILNGTGEEVPLHQALKTKFIEGGAGFMSLIIICLIIGMALAIERILYLSFSKTNTKKLVEKVEDALANGGIEAARMFAATPVVLSLPSSIRVCSAMTRVSTSSRRPSFPTVQSR